MVLAWLALCWLGYPRLVALIGRRRPSIDSSMLAMRVWMYGMLHRDFRVPDTMLMGRSSRASPSSPRERSLSSEHWLVRSRGSTASPPSPRGCAGVPPRKASGWRCSPCSASSSTVSSCSPGHSGSTTTARDDRSGTDATHRGRRHSRLADALARSITGATKLQRRPGLLLRLRHTGLVPPPAARAGNDSLDHDHADPSAVLFRAAANIAAVLAEYSLADLPNPSHLTCIALRSKRT